MLAIHVQGGQTVIELPIKIQINTLQRKIIVFMVSTCNIHSIQCSIRGY